VEHTFADTVFFCNSGTEAAELAIKMARKYRARATRPSAPRSSPSRAPSTAAPWPRSRRPGAEKLTKGFGPLLPGFRQLPFGDHDALRAAAAEPDVGAIMVEPVQGESGIRPLPDQCLKGLRDLCDEHGLLLILDEIQCGMGRTGQALRP
jgi:acetylornithine/N-succinyldiaminopimelate aminotransferase